MAIVLEEIGGLIILLFWFSFWTLLTVGVGRCLIKMLIPEMINRLPWWHLFWWGWGALLMVLQVTHLMLPIRSPVIGFLFLCAAWGFKGARWRKPAIRFSLGVQAVLLCTILVLTRQSPNNADTFFYHYNLIEWQNEYPIIKGLGHFNEQLAFNQTYYFWASLLRFDPLDIPLQHLVNTILWWAAVQPSFRNLRNLFLNRRLSPQKRFLLLLFPVWLYLGVHMNLHNPANDAYVAIFYLMAVECVFAIGERKGRSALEPELRLCWLAFWTLTVKLTSAGMVIMLAGWIGVRLLRELFRNKRMSPAWIKLVVILIFSGLVYLYRGWIISGIPGYPGVIPPESTWAQWAIRGTEVLHDGQKVMSRMQAEHPVPREVAYMWRRASAGELPNPPFDMHDPHQAWNQTPLWLGSTFRTFWRYSDVRFFAPVFFLGLPLMALRFRNTSWAIWCGCWVCLSQLVFLFTTSPFVRFTAPVLWVGATIVFIPWFPSNLRVYSRKVGFLLLFGFWCGGILGALSGARLERKPLTAWWQRPKALPLRLIEGQDGLTWWIGEKKIRLLDAPVPSGSQTSTELRYLDPEKGIRGGVYVPR